MTRLRAISLWSIVTGVTLILLAVSPLEAKEDKKESAKAPKAAAKVDLNNATEEQLKAIKGVGPAYAKKIIAGRPYASVNDLSKAGLPDKLIKKIAPMVAVGAAAARQ